MSRRMLLLAGLVTTLSVAADGQGLHDEPQQRPTRALTPATAIGPVRFGAPERAPRPTHKLHPELLAPRGAGTCALNHAPR